MVFDLSHYMPREQYPKLYKWQVAKLNTGWVVTPPVLGEYAPHMGEDTFGTYKLDTGKDSIALFNQLAREGKLIPQRMRR